jgi:hypothetical protein
MVGLTDYRDILPMRYRSLQDLIGFLSVQDPVTAGLFLYRVLRAKGTVSKQRMIAPFRPIAILA